MMDAKLKHLEMIQAVITRMAQNSFLLKGWSITLVAAILALSANTSHSLPIFFVAALPVLMFWGLDAYFLRQERLFRKLYDNVRECAPEDITFSMNTQPYQGHVEKWSGVVLSKTLRAFHLTIVFLVILLILIF